MADLTEISKLGSQLFVNLFQGGTKVTHELHQLKNVPDQWKDLAVQHILASKKSPETFSLKDFFSSFFYESGVLNWKGTLLLCTLTAGIAFFGAIIVSRILAENDLNFTQQMEATLRQRLLALEHAQNMAAEQNNLLMDLLETNLTPENLQNLGNLTTIANQVNNFQQITQALTLTINNNHENIQNIQTTLAQLMTQVSGA